MKKYYLFIALAMVAGLTVSCKNNKKAEADAEVVEAAKTILADDVLARIDEIQSFAEADKINFESIISSNLTEEEKLVKPDYLLDPSEVNNLATTKQKVNALGILIADRVVMKAYEMPIDEVNDAIARLSAEIDFPSPSPADDSENKSDSERLLDEYQKFKDRGDVALFWQVHFSMLNEIGYIITQNPDWFFKNISEEQYKSFIKPFSSCEKAVEILAEYDPEVKVVWDTYSQFSFNYPDDNAKYEAYKSVEAAKETLISRKDAIAAHRVEILK